MGYVSWSNVQPNVPAFPAKTVVVVSIGRQSKYLQSSYGVFTQVKFIKTSVSVLDTNLFSDDFLLTFIELMRRFQCNIDSIFFLVICDSESFKCWIALLRHIRQLDNNREKIFIVIDKTTT